MLPTVGKTCAAIVGLIPILLSAGSLRPPLVDEAFGQLPLMFEQLGGDNNRFICRGVGYSIAISSGESLLALRSRETTPTPHRRRGRGGSGYRDWAGNEARVRLALMDSRPESAATGLQEMPGTMNYLTGNDPSRWRRHVAVFGQVRYCDVYSGIDLVYYGNQRQLEFDFIVHPSGDPQQIKFTVEGADSITIDSSGDLIMRTRAGDLRQRRPLMYQEVDGRRKEVAGSYVLSRSGGRAESAVISFDVGEYDHSKPLVIDPVLVYSGLLGGIGDDVGWNVAVDSAGNSIVVGETTSVGFPTTNAIFPIYQGDPLSSGNPREVFISKIGPAGTNLIFSTFLGGTDDDAAYAVALDGVDNIYVTGQTASSNFPVTLNAVSRTIHGVPFFGYYPYDAFVTKLNASGTNLMYSTYLGGTRDDVAVGITVDTGANAYVTGFTSSLDFPTINSSAPFGGGITDAFVTKLTMQDSNPVYSLVLGGLGEDRGQSIGVDAAGEALVTGFTDSRDFPTANAVQASYGGGVKDVFVTRLSADGSTRLYSTYLGGSADDEGFYLAVDAPGNAIVTGLTTSTNFPVVNALFSTNHGASDVFVAKIVPAGTSLSYSTYFGGSATDEGWGVVLGTNGSAFIVGTTTSTNYLVSEEIQRGLRASFDVFVFGLDATGTGLLYSVAFGGSGNDFGYGITLDSGGNAIITGGSGSSNFPLLPSTNGLPHGVFNGFSDVFLAKIHPGSLYLSITNQGTGTVALSWPEMFSNYSLQVTGALLATNTWTTATNPVVIGGTNIVVNYTNSGSNSFFRLQPGP